MADSDSDPAPGLAHHGVRGTPASLIFSLFVALLTFEFHSAGAIGSSFTRDSPRLANAAEGYVAGPAFVYAGDMLYLECVMPPDFAAPLVKMQWNSPIPSSLQQGRLLVRRVSGRYRLRITRMTVYDSGMFGCFITYRTAAGLHRTVDARLEVRILPKPAVYPAADGRVFIARGSPAAVAGHTYRAACALRNSAPAFYTWSCTGLNVTRSPRATVDKHSGWLSIRSVQASDAGVCTCRAGSSSGSAVVSIRVEQRFAKPTSLSFFPKFLTFHVDYPYDTGPLPTRCLVKLKHNGSKMTRLTNCTPNADNGGTLSVRIRLDRDFFSDSEMPNLKRLLGKRAEVKIAFSGAKHGRYSSPLMIKLPSAPLLPDGNQIWTIAALCENGTGGTGVNFTVPAPRALATTGTIYLGVTSYQMFVCELNTEWTNCATEHVKERSEWSAASGLFKLPHPGVIDKTIDIHQCQAPIVLGRLYKIVFLASVFGNVNFPVAQSIFVKLQPSNVLRTANSPVPPTADPFREKNVHVAFRMTRTYACSQTGQDKMENSSLLSDKLQAYFQSICRCNVTSLGRGYFRRWPVGNDSCATGKVAREQISKELYLKVDRCSFLHTFSRQMAQLGGIIQIPGDTLGQITFQLLAVDVTNFDKASCPGIKWNIKRDSKTLEKFQCFEPHTFRQYPGTSAAPHTSIRTQRAVSVLPSTTADLVVVTADVVNNEVLEDDRHSIKNILLGSILSVAVAIGIVVLIAKYRRGRRGAGPSDSDLNNNSSNDQNNNSNSASSDVRTTHTAPATLFIGDIQVQPLPDGSVDQAPTPHQLAATGITTPAEGPTRPGLRITAFPAVAYVSSANQPELRDSAASSPCLSGGSGEEWLPAVSRLGSSTLASAASCPSLGASCASDDAGNGALAAAEDNSAV